MTQNGSKTLCCLCCASGPIQAEVHLDRAGYVPGEFILVNGSVENNRLRIDTLTLSTCPNLGGFRPVILGARFCVIINFLMWLLKKSDYDVKN